MNFDVIKRVKLGLECSEVRVNKKVVATFMCREVAITRMYELKQEYITSVAA